MSFAADAKTPPLRPGAIIDLAQISDGERYGLECACRAAAQPFHLGDSTALGRVLGRYKIYFDTRDRGFASHVLLDGYWEMWLTQFVAQVVKPGMVVADIGANFGYYSVLLADLVGPTGRVVAVEPNAAAARMLARSLELNGFAGRSEVVIAAAGAKAGEASLFVPEGEPKNAALKLAGSDAAGQGPNHQTVPVLTLDALLAGQQRVDFLKIDTEGSEESVMAGLSAVIERFRPTIVLEFNPLRCTEPARLVATMRKSYPALSELGFDGKARPVTDAELLDTGNAEDRLIVLAPA